MAQETLFEGMVRSLKTNKLGTLFIISLALLSTTLLHKSFPTVYESQALLRVMSTEESEGQSLAASMNGILAQKPVLMEALQKDGIPDSIKVTGELFALEDAGPGLVKLIVRNANPTVLQPLGDILIKVLSEKFLGYSSEADRFEIEALERKKQAIFEKMRENRIELEKCQIASQPEEEYSLADLEKEIRNSEIKLEEGRRRLSIIPKVRVTASREKSPEFLDAKEKLSKARTQINELLLTYREKHPKVIKVNAEIRELEKIVRATSARKDREEANPEYESALSELTETETGLADIRAKLQALKSSNQPTENLQISLGKSLELRIKALEGMFNEVVVKIEQVSLKRATALGKIQVLRKDPELPRPVGLSLAQRQLIGLLSGTILAVILLYSPLPRNDSTEKIQLSNAALMGYGIPCDQDVETMRRIMRVSLLPPSRANFSHTEALPAPHDERLIVLNEPFSRQLDPFKSLLANLQIQLSETQSRLLMVSSSRSGMGRTTLVANLAILFAKEGYSVVLVDANFRKPALHRVFEIENDRGLSNVSSGDADLEVDQKTFVPNLFIIPSGPLPPNPFELLGSVAVKHFFDGLKRRFELVLIDTPGLLDFPDARIIASLASGVVFLNREGEQESDIRASREFLKTLKTRVLGFVQT